MLHDWPELIKLISGHMRTLRGGAPVRLAARTVLGLAIAVAAFAAPRYLAGPQTPIALWKRVNTSAKSS